MNKTEFLNKINDLEWEDFEIKSALGGLPKSTWETVSAFANTSGGWIVFGVKEKDKTYEIQGLINPEKIEQDFLATLRSSQKFNIFIRTEQVKYNINGRVVLAFYIPVSDKKPVYYNNQTNTFIRRGSSDQKASQAEIDSMFRDQTFGTKTSEIAKGTSYSNLKEKAIQEYRNYMSRFNPNVGYNLMSLNEFLIKMRILDRESQQCTFAGLLFFGNRESIEQFFTDFRIDLIEVPGDSYSDALSRYTFRLIEDDYENIWEAYFECIKRLRKEVEVDFRVSNEGFGEELSNGLLAIREALVNMLMHTDYFAPACPRIRIFNNHIEYYNPGGLPKPLEDLKNNDLSIPRNPILAKLFRLVKLAENAGYGFDKIDANWKVYNNTYPEYIIDFDSVILKLNTVTKNKTSTIIIDQKVDFELKLQKEFNSLIERLSILPNENMDFLMTNYGEIMGYLRGKYGVNVEVLDNQSNQRGIYILLLIDCFPSITKDEMSIILNCSISSIEKSMQKVRKHVIIVRKGSDKTGIWSINK